MHPIFIHIKRALEDAGYKLAWCYEPPTVELPDLDVYQDLDNRTCYLATIRPHNLHAELIVVDGTPNNPIYGTVVVSDPELIQRILRYLLMR